MKRYDSFSMLDDNNTVTGHFCFAGDCYHCKLNVPIVLPSVEGMRSISGRTLAAIAKKLSADLESVHAALSECLSEGA